MTIAPSSHSTPVSSSAYVPAAAIAAGVLVPSWTPSRRAATVLGVAAARAWADEKDGPGSYFVVKVDDVDLLTPETEQLLSRVASSLVIGLGALPAIGLVRALPVGRLAGAAALAGGYLAADRWLRAQHASARASTARHARHRAAN